MIKTTAAKGSKKKQKVTFALPQDVGPVSVVGTFNDWDPMKHPMKKRSNGTRSVSVELKKGETHEFRYLADGDRWLNEPDVDAKTNQDGTVNSILEL